MMADKKKYDSLALLNFNSITIKNKNKKGIILGRQLNYVIG